MGDMIEFASNGGTGGGYLATPVAGVGGPGVVVIQEWWGLVDHIKDVCDRFAAAGFVALAPDLYHGRSVPPGEPDEAGKVAMALKLDVAGQDMSGAVDELQRRSAGGSGAGVGVVGFCMGGALALMLAAQRPDAVVACVPFYGVSLWADAPHPDYSQMRAAVLGHYAGKDQFFTPEAALALEADLRAAGREVELHIYLEADHAFFNDTRPEVYDAESSALAWERTLAFLRDRLG